MEQTLRNVSSAMPRLDDIATTDFSSSTNKPKSILRAISIVLPFCRLRITATVLRLKDPSLSTVKKSFAMNFCQGNKGYPHFSANSANSSPLDFPFNGMLMIRGFTAPSRGFFFTPTLAGFGLSMTSSMMALPDLQRAQQDSNRLEPEREGRERQWGQKLSLKKRPLTSCPYAGCTRGNLLRGCPTHLHRRQPLELHDPPGLHSLRRSIGTLAHPLPIP